MVRTLSTAICFSVSRLAFGGDEGGGGTGGADIVATELGKYEVVAPGMVAAFTGNAEAFSGVRHPTAITVVWALR